MHTDHIISFNSVTFSHSGRQIFDSFSLNIPRGKVTAIMGPSGSGKTTLLRLISAQIHPDAGEVIVNGQNIHQLSQKALYKMREQMGMLFQSGALFTNINVFENVAFPIREHTNLSDSMLYDLVMMKLEAVGLRGAQHLMPQELSGGMTRRVALARTIALDPELIMYDEPFAGQDPITLGVLARLIERLNKAFGMTSIIVSHDVHETLQIADYIYVIAGGRLIGQGDPETICANDSPDLQQFLKGLPDGVVPFHYPAKTYREDLGFDS